MGKVIVYWGPVGVSVLNPAPNSSISIEDVAKKDVPDLKEYLIVDESALPKSYPQSTWSIDFALNQVLVDAEKAKQVYEKEALEVKNALIGDANTVINENNWVTKLSLGRLKEVDKIKLNEWLDYIDLLEGKDLSEAPDINWPIAPET